MKTLRIIAKFLVFVTVLVVFLEGVGVHHWGLSVALLTLLVLLEYNLSYDFFPPKGETTITVTDHGFAVGDHIVINNVKYQITKRVDTTCTIEEV